MKKLLLTISLLAVVAVANAQFAASIQLGGSHAVTGNSTTIVQTFDTLGIPQFDTVTTIPVNNNSATIGLKLGYQLGRVQFGISGSFTQYFSNGEQSAAQYVQANPNSRQMTEEAWVVTSSGGKLVPYIDQITEYEGNFTERFNSFTIAPYVRFELIQLGDVAFFAELSGFFTKVNKPVHHDYLDWWAFEMHNTIDTTFTIDRSSIAFGAKITPGLSWQLTEHSCLDLYFDILALAYQKSVLTENVLVEDYTNVWEERTRYLQYQERINTVTTATALGYNINGLPGISEANRSWVRVGFSYTF